MCMGRVEVSDSTGPGVETSILEQGQDTDGPASVERRVSHRGAVDSRGQVALGAGPPSALEDVPASRPPPARGPGASTPPTPQSWQL